MDGIKIDLDVIIPVGNLVPNSLQSRVETLQYALANFYGRQTGVKFKIILVEQSLDDKLYYLPNLPERIKTDYHLPEIEVRHVSVKYPVFNKSWCINVGFRHSEAPLIMVADPDMFCREDYFTKLLDWMGSPWAFAWNELYYTEMSDKHMILEGKDPSVKPHCGPKVGYSEGGLVLFRREYFERIGMANEFIEELGGIDNEMMSRARHHQPFQHNYPMFVWHLWHEGSQKKTRPTREKNVGICIQARNNPGKMIKVLRKLNENIKLNMTHPYCAEHSLEEEWANIG